jgi:hypothetical protein
MPGTSEQAEMIIHDKLEKAIAYELSGSHTKAIKALGEGLHTLQDKYAHFMQDAGLYEHLPRLGTNPDDPVLHSIEFRSALIASRDYVNLFLMRIEKRNCDEH